MRKHFGKQLPFVMILIALACIGSVALAQQPPDKADPNNPPPDPQQQGQPMPGAPMIITMGPGGGQGRMRLGGPMMIGDALERFINMLGAINLKTDFTLTADQKQKIQVIRDDCKQVLEKWRGEHADELKQMEEQQQEIMTNLQQGNPPDPNQMMEIEEQRRQLMESAPNGEDHVEQIKALFTPEQTKTFEAKRAEIDKEREAQFQRMGGARFFPGPPPGGPGGPPDPNAQPGDKKGK